MEEVPATAREVTALAGRLLADGVELAVMESASDYWRIWFYLLEAAGLRVQLVNSRHARQLARRPKTDKLDAQWIARLAEMGLLRPSFVPPPEIRALRDLTRTRLQLVRDRTREWQRLEKLLEGDLLTELSDVSSAQAGCASDWPGYRDVRKIRIARLLQPLPLPRSPRKPDIRTLTGRLPSPRCRFSTSAAARPEHSCTVRDLLLHANLATRLGLFGEALVKLSSAVSSLARTKTAQDIVEAIVGESDPRALAALAAAHVKGGRGAVEQALEGMQVRDHHRMPIRVHLDHIALLDRSVAAIEDEIESALDAQA